MRKHYGKYNVIRIYGKSECFFYLENLFADFLRKVLGTLLHVGIPLLCVNKIISIKYAGGRICESIY